jgi:hypothetical protein
MQPINREEVGPVAVAVKFWAYMSGSQMLRGPFSRSLLLTHPFTFFFVLKPAIKESLPHL